MSKNIRYSTCRRIYKEYNRRLFSIANKIANKKDSGEDYSIDPQIRKDLEWAEKISKLADISKRNIQRCHSLIVLIICTIAILFVTIKRVDSTPIALTIVSHNLTAKLKSDWAIASPLSPNHFTLDYVVSAKSDKLPPSGEALNLQTPDFPFRVGLKGDGIAVRKISISANATIDFTYKNNKLQMFVKDSSVQTTLDASQADLTLGKPGGYRSIRILVKESNPPETLRFGTKKMEEIPILLEMGFGGKKKWFARGIKVDKTNGLQEMPIILKLDSEDKRKWNFKRIQAQTISFSEEFPLGSSNFRSSIQRGEIKMKISNQMIALTEGDVLFLRIKKNKKINIYNSNNGVGLSFEGDVSQIFTGIKGEKNIKPTYLEYYFHQKRQLTIWTALTGLFAILWSIHNFIFWK